LASVAVFLHQQSQQDMKMVVSQTKVSALKTTPVIVLMAIRRRNLSGSSPPHDRAKKGRTTSYIRLIADFGALNPGLGGSPPSFPPRCNSFAEDELRRVRIAIVARPEQHSHHLGARLAIILQAINVER